MQILPEERIYAKMRHALLLTYDETRIPKFELIALDEHFERMRENFGEQALDQFNKAKEDFLVGLIKFLYKHSCGEELSIGLKLIEEIGRKCPKAGINIFFLQAYQRIYATHDKYGLDMDISSIMPVSGIFIKSKDIADLFDEV